MTPQERRDRRASRRNSIQVRLELKDVAGRFTGRTVDISRIGLCAATNELRPVGTLLRMKVLGQRGAAVFAVGVVVRGFQDLEGSGEGTVSPGLAVAITSTSEAWDRFWDGVYATEEEDDGGLGGWAGP